MTSGKLFTCFGAPFFCPCPSVSLSLPLYSFTKNNKWTVHLMVKMHNRAPQEVISALGHQTVWLVSLNDSHTDFFCLYQILLFLFIFYCHFTVQVCVFIFLILSYYCTLLTSYVYVIFSYIYLLFYLIFLKTTMCYIN